jgi:glycosyltransferase involved in cell wall biosynthesis
MTGRPTLAVAVHDGFYGAGTGAGYANHAFLHTLTGLIYPGVRLVVLPVRLTPDSPEYQPSWHRQTHVLLQQLGATTYPVDNGTTGMARFGGLSSFRRLAAHTAACLTRHVLPGAEPLAVILFDVPFLGVAPLLPPSVLPHVTAVPRSTAILHDPTNDDRIHWERHGLHVTADGGGHVAAISVHMRHHLHHAYDVPEHAVVDLPDGLTPADRRFSTTDSPPLPPTAAGGFLLAMGRAQPYKGFDDLIDALTHLRGHGHRLPHIVLAAVTEDLNPSPYQRYLADRLRTSGLEATLLTRFSPAVRALLTHPALRAVVVPSRAEPFGRVPVEAYTAGAAPVIATTAGGLAEQVIDGVTGLTAAPGDPDSLADAIHRGLTLTRSERAQMRDAARRFAADRYDYTTAVSHFLCRTAPWATRHRTGRLSPADARESG